MLTKPNLEYQSRKLVNIMKENNNIGFNVESRCKLNKESLFDKYLYFNVLEYVEMKITPSKVWSVDNGYTLSSTPSNQAFL